MLGELELEIELQLAEAGRLGRLGALFIGVLHMRFIISKVDNLVRICCA